MNDRKDYLQDVFNHFYIKRSLDLFNNSKLSFNVYYLGYKQHATYPTSDGNSVFMNMDNFSNKIFSFDVNYSKHTKMSNFLVGLGYKDISYILSNYDVDYFDENFINNYLDLKRTSDHKFNSKLEDSYWLFSFSF